MKMTFHNNYEGKFINDFSHFYTGLTSQVIIWMPTLNLVFSMFRYFNLPIIMYHVESSPNNNMNKYEKNLVWN